MHNDQDDYFSNWVNGEEQKALFDVISIMRTANAGVRRRLLAAISEIKARMERRMEKRKETMERRKERRKQMRVRQWRSEGSPVKPVSKTPTKSRLLDRRSLHFGWHYQYQTRLEDDGIEDDANFFVLDTPTKKQKTTKARSDNVKPISSLVIKKAVTKAKPVSKKSSTESKPATKTPTGEKPAAKKLTAKTPTSTKPAAKETTGKKPVAKMPVTKKPAGETPASKKRAAKTSTGKTKSATNAKLRRSGRTKVADVEEGDDGQ